MDVKFCPYCSKVLPIQAFMTRHGSAYGYCRPCMTLYQRARAFGNIEKKPVQCGICGVYFITGVKPVVDHSHVTKRFRDFLCTNCNIGLGQFKDSPERLQKAIEYLAKHPDDLSLVGVPIKVESEVELEVNDKTPLELHESNECGGAKNKCRFHLLEQGVTNF
jgi:hypothetical protein